MTKEGTEPEGTAGGKSSKEKALSEPEGTAGEHASKRKSDSEHRAHKRYSIPGCAIRYKPDSFLSRFSKASHKYMVLDISQGGIQFITREKFNEQTCLLLEISAPTLNKETIHIKGRVVWIRASSSLHIYGVGVEFVNMNVAERLRLQLLLDDAAGKKSEIPDKVHLDKIEKT